MRSGTVVSRAGLLPAHFCFRAEDCVAIEQALPPEVELAAILAVELFANEIVGKGGEVDLAGLGGSLHPAGEIHRVAKYIESELSFADHSGDDGTLGEAHTHLPFDRCVHVALFDGGLHGEGCANRALRMIGQASGSPPTAM